MAIRRRLFAAELGSRGARDRSTLLGLPSGYPNSIGGTDFARLADYSASDFAPRGVTASLRSNGILVSWRPPSELTGCAGYERKATTGSGSVLRSRPHPDGSGARIYEYVPVAPVYQCAAERAVTGYEVYRTSFGKIFRDGAVVDFSDNQPYLIGKVDHSGNGTHSYQDTSGDALIGPRRHNYAIRALFGHDTDNNPNRDYGSRLSPNAWAFRDDDAQRPNAESPQNLRVRIPTKEQVATDGHRLGAYLSWDPPASSDVSSVTGYVIQRRIWGSSHASRSLPFTDVLTYDRGTPFLGIGPNFFWHLGGDGAEIVDASADVVDSAHNRLHRLKQYSYRVIALRSGVRSNASEVASTDSDRQMYAEGLVSVSSVSRHGAVIRVNLSGNDADGNQLSSDARGEMFNGHKRLLSLSIGATGWAEHSSENILNMGCKVWNRTRSIRPRSHSSSTPKKRRSLASSFLPIRAAGTPEEYGHPGIWWARSRSRRFLDQREHFLGRCRC